MHLRPDLQEILDDIDAADRRGEEIAAPLSDAQFGWQPDEGRAWSVSQCLDHLATINVLYGGAIRKAVDEARARGVTGGGAIAPTLFGAKYVASMEPPVTRRFRTPASVKPRPSASRDEIMRAYHAAHDQIRELVRRAAEIDVNRVTFPNPFLPLFRVRVGTGLRIIPAHDRRHLWQAEQVTRAPGFPR